MAAVTHCLSALIEKRAEVAGEIRTLEDRAEQLRADLLHLDAVIRLMNPGFQPEAIRPKVRRPRRNWFGQNELLRAVLEVLRRAGGEQPMSAREVALAVMERKGFDPNDAATVRLVEKRVFSALKRREGSVVAKVEYGPRSVAWRIRS